MGLYVHVPFCVRKCPYCSFFSVAEKDFRLNDYIKAVTRQAKSIGDSGLTKGRSVETIFVGGGTPSLLAPEQLAGLLQQFCLSFQRVLNEAEVSVEVNPATVDKGNLVHLRRAGYNRISIGVQSLSDDELQKIGRPHSANDAIQTITDARKAGFANLNIDLMYRLPGQSVMSWQQTLERVLDQEPDHLAIYELTIEHGTQFHRLQQQNRLNLPTEDEVMEMMALTQEAISKAGFRRYEISNYARPGKECYHNINYWNNGWYVGLGPGAVSYFDGARYTAVKDIEEFCHRISQEQEWWIEREVLDTEARFRETVVMGLRMTKGISATELSRRFGINPFEYYGRNLDQLKEQNMISIEVDRIHLTRKGMDLANQVMVQLV